MLKKPMGYDSAEAVNIGEFKAITPGWYPAVIHKVMEGSTPNGAEFLEFWIDIIDGEFIRYYEKDYKAQRPDIGGEKKWRGTVRYFTTEKALPMLKGGITAIEESNPGYTFDWNDATVKGKKVGVGIRREQYEATDGQLKFATRPFAFCDIKKVISGEMDPPKDRLLSNAPARAAAPARRDPAGFDPYTVQGANAPKFEELDSSEELPF